MATGAFLKDFLKGLPFLGVWIFFFYEWISLTFRGLGMPSISHMTYGWMASYPPLMQAFFAFIAGGLVILLALHLLGLLSWWEP